MIFDDWDIEIEQEPFKCPLCNCGKYKLVTTETNKKRYDITVKVSGLIKDTKAKKSPDILITKDFAECLSCRNRTLLNESEEVIPKEKKKEVADKLAQAKFNKHFLNPELKGK